MPPEDDAFAALAVGLNEEAKATRRRRAKEPVEPEPEMTNGELIGEKGHELAIERMEAMADELTLDTSGMVQDVRDFLLDTIKARPKPWSGTPAGEQRDVAAACLHSAQELVRKVAEAVAANGREPIRALVTKVTLGDDIAISLKAKPFTPDETDAAVMALHRAHGKHVMIIVASADDYSDARDAAIDEDEPEIQFGDLPGPEGDRDLAGEDPEDEVED